MANYNFIGGDGKSYGPYTADQMRQFMVQNRLTAQSQVSGDGGPWQPVGSFPELMGGAGTPAQPYPQSAAAPVESSTNPMAITGMICGILSLLTGCCCGVFGLPFSILGVIFSIIGLSKLKKNPGQGGRGMAIAGLIIGALGLIAAILMVVVFAMSGALS